jgi:hypothetical protein
MDIAAAVREAESAALAAGRTYFQAKMNGRDGDCCGFAWVEVSGGTAGDRAALAAAGFASSGAKPLTRTFDHGAETQGLSCKEAANEVAAAVLRRAGLKARMRSMMD